jgi:hypothetical protein
MRHVARAFALIAMPAVLAPAALGGCARLASLSGDPFLFPVPLSSGFGCQHVPVWCPSPLPASGWFSPSPLTFLFFL